MSNKNIVLVGNSVSIFFCCPSSFHEVVYVCNIKVASCDAITYKRQQIAIRFSDIKQVKI